MPKPKTYRQLITDFSDWGEVQPGPEADYWCNLDQLNHGALVEILARVRTSNEHLASIRLDLSRVLERLLADRPAPPESPAAGKARREQESRGRAWAAYVAAGGTMPAEDDAGPYDPDGEPGDREYMPFVGNKVWRAMRQLGINPLADDCMRRLAGFTAEAFGRCKGIGPMAVQSVREALKVRGLAFKGEAVGGES